MADNKTIIIDSRLGRREVRLDRVLHFPRGVIGYETLREFTLLQIRERSPLLVLQSMEAPALGLIVADPYAFVADYNLRVSDADQHVLQAESAADLAVLVTATIPPGKPEETALNLLGPIIVNHRARLGLQAPQVDGDFPPRVFVHMLETKG